MVVFYLGNLSFYTDVYLFKKMISVFLAATRTVLNLSIAHFVHELY